MNHELSSHRPEAPTERAKIFAHAFGIAGANLLRAKRLREIMASGSSEAAKTDAKKTLATLQPSFDKLAHHLRSSGYTRKDVAGLTQIEREYLLTLSRIMHAEVGAEPITRNDLNEALEAIADYLPN